MDEALLTKVTENAERSKSNSHRIDKLEEQTALMHEMNTNISVMVNEMKDTKNEIKEVKDDVNGVKQEVQDMKMQPANDYKKIMFEVIKWLVIFGLGYFVNMLVK